MCIRDSNNSGDNTDFVTAMKNAGFPDSYIPNLTALHNKYPSWTFEAVNTGLNWDTVIENESVNGLNPVSYTHLVGRISALTNPLTFIIINIATIAVIVSGGKPVSYTHLDVYKRQAQER